MYIFGFFFSESTFIIRTKWNCIGQVRLGIRVVIPKPPKLRGFSLLQSLHASHGPLGNHVLSSDDSLSTSWRYMCPPLHHRKEVSWRTLWEFSLPLPKVIRVFPTSNPLAKPIICLALPICKRAGKHGETHRYGIKIKCLSHKKCNYMKSKQILLNLKYILWVHLAILIFLIIFKENIN